MQVEPFWPQTLNDWLTSIGKFVALGVLVGGFVGRWLRGQLNGLRESLKLEMDKLDLKHSETAASCQAHSAQIADILKKQQASEFDRTTIHQNVGRLEGVVDRLEKLIDKDREARQKEELERAIQLTRIESNMNIATAIDDGMRQLADALRSRNN